MNVKSVTRRIGFLAASFMLAAAAAQAASTEIFSDNFADGVRNTALWRIAAYDEGGFKETGGHLALRTTTPSAPNLLVSGWAFNFDRICDGKDEFDIRAVVRAPHKVKQTGKNYELGIGLFQSRADHNYIELTVMDSSSNRQFGVYHLSNTTSSENYYTLPAPTNISVYVLRMRYKAESNKVFMYWSVPGSTTWHSLGSASFTTLFNRTPPHTMRPYIVSYIDQTLVPLSWNVYVDDFIGIYKNAP